MPSRSNNEMIGMTSRCKFYHRQCLGSQEGRTHRTAQKAGNKECQPQASLASSLTMLQTSAAICTDSHVRRYSWQTCMSPVRKNTDLSA